MRSATMRAVRRAPHGPGRERAKSRHVAEIYTYLGRNLTSSAYESIENPPP